MPPSPPAPPGPDDDLAARRRRRLGYYFPPAQIIAIFALLIGLIAVVTLKDGCARGVENLFKAFDQPDAGPAPRNPMPRP